MTCRGGRGAHVDLELSGGCVESFPNDLGKPPWRSARFAGHGDAAERCGDVEVDAVTAPNAVVSMLEGDDHVTANDAVGEALQRGRVLGDQ